VNWEIRFNLVLAVAVAISAISLVYFRFEERTLVKEMRTQEVARIAARQDNRMLKLEQQTWSSPWRIEKVAREQLSMVQPDFEDMVVIR